jgi:hypothetical protein
MKFLGWCFIFFGFFLTANTLIAGPHAIGFGWIGVIFLSFSGLLAILIGLYILKCLH